MTDRAHGGDPNGEYELPSHPPAPRPVPPWPLTGANEEDVIAQMRRDAPAHGVHVIPGQVPEGVVPLSASLTPPPEPLRLPAQAMPLARALAGDPELLYQIRVTLTFHLSDHVSLPPEQRAQVSHALTDAITPDIREALAAARDGTDKLRRQVMGHRGLKELYLRERNAAHADLIEAERIIELLCNDREAGQRVVKAAITEQRQHAEEAEGAVQRVRTYALWCDQHDVEPDVQTINAVLDGTDTYPYGDHIDQPKEPR
ncbi:hypothetical protein [Actinomadura sp. GTD37]|uniref:hypothetical protein n=1 Tax=Actinomadura sp. GTD37 TaxID=1778030 RepID=UPI0035C2383A